MPESSQSSPRFPWFTAGCIVLILMGAAHTVAVLRHVPPPPGDDWATLDRLMNSLEVSGTGRTMMRLFDGFGWFFTLASIMMAAAGLSLLPLARSEPAIARRLALVYTLGTGAFLTTSLLYWFFIPTSFLAMSFVLFAAAALRDGRAGAA